MDIAGIWQRCFRGAKGIWKDLLREIPDFITMSFKKEIPDRAFCNPLANIATFNRSYFCKDRYDSKNADRLTVICQLLVYSPVISLKRSNVYSSTFSLSQNYANPVNGHATMEFDVLKPGLCTFEVIDLLGKKLATLIDRVVTPGKPSVDFNAQRLYRRHILLFGAA